MMASRCHPRRLELSVLVLVALAFPAALQGQQEPDTVVPPPVETGPVETAEASVGGVNDALQRIGTLRTSVIDAASVAELNRRVEALEDRYVTAVEVPFLSEPVEQLDRARIEALLLVLPRLSADVERGRQDVSGALSELAAVRDSLRVYDERWTGFAEATDAEDLSPEVAGIVESVLAAADSGRAEARTRSGELVALEARTVALGTRLAELIAEAEARERTLLVDLLEQDAGAIWTIPVGRALGQFVREVAAVPATLEQGIEDLVEAYQGRVILHGILALTLLLLILGFTRSAALAEAPELETARRIFRHPLAVTVILTLALTQTVYPTAQDGVIALNTVLFLTAELVVLRAALPSLSPAIVWGGGALLAFARIVFLLPYDTGGHRLAVLLGSLAGIAVVHLTRQVVRQYAEHDRGRWLTVADRVLLLFIVLFGAAVLTNLLGMIGMATLVTRSVVRSVLAGLGLLTLALVLRELLEVALRTRALMKLRSVRAERARIVAAVSRTLSWAGMLAWVWATLVAFRFEDRVGAAVGAVFGFELQFGAVSVAPATLMIFGLAVWLAVNVSRVTRFFLDQDVLPRLSLPRGVPGAISTSVHYVIVALALAFGVTAMGVDLSSVAFIVGALGVGIGFGLQNIINNFISGLILLFERPLQVGDEVQIGQLMGTMQRIGIRASVVRTYEGSEVIVPNGDLISQQVINYTLSDRYRRLELRVGVAYGTDLDRARNAILDALTSVEEVLETPAPMVLFNGFGESSLDFRVLFWVPDFGLGLETGSALGMAINRALRDAGIEIPFPQRDLHLRTAPASALDGSAIVSPGRPEAADHDPGREVP